MQVSELERDRAGVADCELRLLEGIHWEELAPERLAKLTRCNDGLLLSDAVQEGLATPEGRVTLFGGVCLASCQQPIGAMTCRLHRYPMGRAEAALRGLPPQVSRLLPPPLTLAVDALALEIALQIVRAPLEQVRMETLLREVLHNAVGHRSYRQSLLEVPIDVRLWADAVEVESPGGLAGEVEIADGWFYGRLSRNPRLMALLTRMGRTQQQGQGTEMIPRVARHLGWSVTAEERAEVVSVRLERVVRGAPSTARRLPRAEVTERIVELLARTGALSTRGISEQLGVPAPSVRAALKDLVDGGDVQRTQPSSRAPNQKYRLTLDGRS